MRREKEELERTKKERDFWKRALISEIEDNIADPTGAVSENEICGKLCKHEKALQRVLKERDMRRFQVAGRWEI